ncbi:SH3 and multiple ankyrin repeat domains protein 3 [Bagarius yarrelli]|uniref:SH3 and multiple ankyrin repeat domains protein 3 n=1 Tax=Bagarius yarrelli TaxID=175774 RepID=A0A556TQG5_BAGYA|nr:SH3 and multiple ankyrin repeat domains protein 3 [Bagarius yarrelli]
MGYRNPWQESVSLKSRVCGKCMKFNLESPIWLSKQRILCALNQSLKDVLNYGLFLPAYNGKAGKFLDEQRSLKEYPLPTVTPIPYLEFRYKRRVYTQAHLDDKQLAKLHTKTNSSFSTTIISPSDTQGIRLHSLIHLIYTPFLQEEKDFSVSNL